MAHAPRSTTLPHPGSQLSTRDIYSSATPAFRRQPDHHIPRSPSFQGIRRHPLSPTPSSYPLKMDPGYGSKTQQNIPPLNSMTPLGTLSYNDANSTPIKVEINGIIDKGFFLAEDHWTCYRRNYFSCVCSYSLSPMPPAFPNTPLQFVQTGSQQPYTVYGFAMSISAVVADSDNQPIELVQHTPKRDKGPVAKPEKVRLSPKPPQPSHHPLNNSMYGGPDAGLGSSRQYEGYPQQQSSAPTEHTFERIQFKQATANNGKRRAAQQYYHLLVELWADVGSQAGGDQFVKVAYRKSAKMIVRGRSPGHYQNERRGSTSSGPGGSGGGSISGGYPQGMIGSSEYGPGSGMMAPGYASGYDPRSGSYGGGRHHGHEMEHMISAEEEKILAAGTTKGYQYYPTPLYEGGEQDPRHHQVELYSTARSEPESSAPPALGGAFDPTKVEPKGEPGLPSLFYPSPSFFSPRCGRFEGKPTSNGYYPTAIPPSSSMNMT
ncbi:hypothetical protein B0H66DRAFT_266779 [Apodospora peruviana]|uniref:NDT80 domain-containing protein n=1 Tax=Apodospora peruviana TaxID=516989 RepID=A0AAE0I6E3_9PEZI|nr:hypothetical protein B0H66DRAFT_266779 [Apodospora peruviana]